jgi:hypothetical protein
VKRRRSRWLLLPLAVLVLAAAGAFYGWLHSGPRYPQYCWLAFGSEADARLLVRFDGRTLAIDRNGDGKFEGKDEHLPLVKDYLFDGKEERINHVAGEVVIRGADGQTSFVLIVSVTGRTEQPWTVVNLEVFIRGPFRYSQSCAVAMADKAEGAPLAHIDGPLTVQLINDGTWSPMPAPLQFRLGGVPSDLRVFVATVSPGGTGMAAVRIMKDPKTLMFPDWGHPFADVGFPPKRPGEAPMRRRYPLAQFC